ncbi:MAG TPA: hypothetical protein VM328_07265 [Fimbriimonadaceae bacterium]|nr:hypothetical protein [Fimbriimonadaceae bacterium]
MNNALRSQVGKTVKVYMNQGLSDRGVLIEVDDKWVVLEQPDGQRLYLSLAQVRLVKPQKD